MRQFSGVFLVKWASFWSRPHLKRLWRQRCDWRSILSYSKPPDELWRLLSVLFQQKHPFSVSFDTHKWNPIQINMWKLECVCVCMFKILLFYLKLSFCILYGIVKLFACKRNKKQHQTMENIVFFLIYGTRETPTFVPLDLQTTTKRGEDEPELGTPVIIFCPCLCRCLCTF